MINNTINTDIINTSIDLKDLDLIHIKNLDMVKDLCIKGSKLFKFSNIKKVLLENIRFD